MKAIDVLATVLLVVGGLNWGLVGLANLDLVATLTGDMTTPSRIVYALVGVSAVYQAAAWNAIRTRWSPARASA